MNVEIFGYSFFWTAATIIYFLMRYKVDDTDMDEVHMEEEDLEEPLGELPTAGAVPTDAKPVATGNVTMVEAPALRTPSPTPVTATPPPTEGGIGNPPGAG